MRADRSTLLRPVLALLLVVAAVALAGPAGFAESRSVAEAGAVVETEPVLSQGDAADDPAIWRDPREPANSVLIGNDKGGALEVYDLHGRRIQRLADGFYGNVDTRAGFLTGTGVVDLVVTYRAGVRVFAIDPGSRTLGNITDHPSGSIPSPIGGEGLCLYRSAEDGETYAFVNNRNGVVLQLRLADVDGDGLVEGTQTRRWDVGGEVEGCVADDEHGLLYISEERVGIWRYGAEPGASTEPDSRTLVDSVVEHGGRIRADAEGLTIVDQPGTGGYLIASSQAASRTRNSYLVYDRGEGNRFLREFRVTDSDQADGCGRTDGIDALAADLGPRFPLGVFVCQDDHNTAPAPGHQNFKLVPLERVVPLAGAPQPPADPTAVIDHDCSFLACTFSASRSFDADGHVAAYRWVLPDGTESTRAGAEHTFAAAGEHPVQLTVTDNSGGTDTIERVVTVTDEEHPITFVDGAMANANSATHQVTVPTATRAGDTLLLLMGTNTTAEPSRPGGVTGWRQLDVVAMPSSRSTVWSKVAGGSDAGRQVTVELPQLTKAHLAVLVYRGTSRDPIAEFRAVAEPEGEVSHRTPAVPVQPASWVVSYWTHKDSEEELLRPASEEVTVRLSGTQSGGGNVKGLVADSGGPVLGSTSGEVVATGPDDSSSASTWTIALRPDVR